MHTCMQESKHHPFIARPGEAYETVFRRRQDERLVPPPVSRGPRETEGLWRSAGRTVMLVPHPRSCRRCLPSRGSAGFESTCADSHATHDQRLSQLSTPVNSVAHKSAPNENRSASQLEGIKHVSRDQSHLTSEPGEPVLCMLQPYPSGGSASAVRKTCSVRVSMKAARKTLTKSRRPPAF